MLEMCIIDIGYALGYNGLVHELLSANENEQFLIHQTTQFLLNGESRCTF